jgi:hypothetical protein
MQEFHIAFVSGFYLRHDCNRRPKPPGPNVLNGVAVYADFANLALDQAE